MSRALSVVVFALATAAAWYLGEVDRLSPLAMEVVELETTIGAPPWWIGAGLTVLAAIALLVQPRRAPRVAARREAPPAVAKLPTAGADWYDVAATAARALPLSPQGRLRVDETPGLPFTLVLRGATMEQARRRIELYAGFLAAIPTPPRGRVYLESCPDVTMNHQLLVAAAFKPHHPPDTYLVRASGGSVDIAFSRPDPRWAARA